MNRQESLFAILPRAVKAAKENGGNQLVVLYGPAYVDEFAEGVHVYCPRMAVPLLYPARAGWDRECDAVVEKDGSVFLTKLDDTLEMLKRGQAKFASIKLQGLDWGNRVDSEEGVQS